MLKKKEKTFHTLNLESQTEQTVLCMAVGFCQLVSAFAKMPYRALTACILMWPPLP